jgi:hydroxymethylglutaryl-CoA lyase
MIDLPHVDVAIRDVCPRDGLQAEQPVPVAGRRALAVALAAAGLRDVEAASFVSPRAVPAMAGASEVVADLPTTDGTRWWALVPNRRGVELARQAGISHLTMTISASDGYSRKNVGVDTTGALASLAEIAAAATGCQLDVVVSCAFGSPFDDVTSVSEVEAAVQSIRESGIERITLADTTGTATPRRIRDVLRRVGTDVGLHLHDTRATALANALAALDLDVRRFDTAVGGLGGSPFAPGAGGNLATEDLVIVLEDAGVSTGIDLDALLRISAELPHLIGHPVPSRVAAAGRLSTFASV